MTQGMWTLSGAPSTTSLIGYYHLSILSIFQNLGSPLSYHMLIFDLMSSGNMYLYNAYINTYILLTDLMILLKGRSVWLVLV